MHQGAIAKLSKFTVEYYYCFPTLSCTLFLEFGGSGASNLVYHQASPDDLDSEYENASTTSPAISTALNGHHPLS